MLYAKAGSAGKAGKREAKQAGKAGSAGKAGKREAKQAGKAGSAGKRGRLNKRAELSCSWLVCPTRRLVDTSVKQAGGVRLDDRCLRGHSADGSETTGQVR